MDDGKPINIVLIHGTFARHAKWIQPHSLLCNTLQGKFPNSDLLAFEWSGHNSHSARVNAGKRLSEYLEHLRAKDPGRSCFVIAHSHGGNVLLYALSQKSAQESVDGCVFLGTPFLMTRRRSLRTYVDTLSFQLTWLALYVPPTVLLVLWLGAFGGFLVSLAVFMFAVIIAPQTWFERNITDPLTSILLKTLAKRQEAFGRYVTPMRLNRRSLVYYAPDDEAQKWLKLVNWISRMPFISNEYIVQFVHSWPFLLLMIWAGIVIDWLIGERNAFVVRGLLPCLVLMMSSLPIVVLMSFILPAISVLLRGHFAGFGWEGLFGYSLVEVYSARQPISSPDTVITGVEWQPMAGFHWRLRHSGFYLDREVAESIADWINHPPTTGSGIPIWVQNSEESQMAQPNERKVFSHCFVFLLAIFLLGSAWSFWSLFRHIRDVSSEITEGNIASREIIVGPANHMLRPKEEQAWKFSLQRPPKGQTCHLLGHYKANSVEGHLYLGLERGPPEWENSRGCGFEGKVAYTEGLGTREASFSRKVDFGETSTMRGCISITNLGKKTDAMIEVDLEWLCLEN